ncbi:hypothetical protein INT45_006227 [Circinella minor]|uniref:F-box/LRR-repeat protein 15/At3g58940/PEG3-like LRR domain-containing protein n=1 Tax=Circinella minor TaxID=1195481 RepID=A0A8H7RX01_9FUNG|nr:hypothetical protein INT45_006227 [Circinella minor]
MSVCPSLSHLVFTPYPDNILNEDEPTISPPDDRIPTTIDNDNGIMFRNMLSLSIDSSISYNRRLAAILKRCPNLRILRINNDVIDWRNREGINMDSIFQLCPNVEYVECNNTQSYYRRNTQPSNKIADEIIFKHYSPFGRTTRNNSNHGLRDLFFYEPLDSHTMNALLRQINNHNNTLQLLELGLKRDSPISWDGIASIYTPNLRILRLDKIYCSEEAIAVLLSHCPALEELLLHTRPVFEAYGRPFYALRSLEKLKKLTVNYRYGVKSDDDNGLIHHDNVIRGTRGVHQEPSFLVPMREYLDSVNHTSSNAALEEFHVRANNWINLNNDQFLYSVSGLPKLRCLTLVNHTNIDAKSPFITVQGVQEFVQRLHQNTKIEELSLAGIEKLGSKAINNLADLKYLKKLILFGCEHYTGGDLIQLVERTKSLREITIDDIDLEQCTGLYGAVDYIERQSSLDYGAVMVGPNEVKIEYLGLD